MCTAPSLVKLRFRLRTLSMFTLSIGHREAALAADLTFVRHPVTRGSSVVEVPVIPGSSLKGVLRRIAARVVTDSCMSISTRDLAASPTCGILVKHGLRRDLCLVCKCFGTPDVQGLIEISDAKPTEETMHVLARYGLLHTYTHVSISRHTQTCEKGALWMREFVPVGAEFEAEALCLCPDGDTSCLKLLLFTLGVLKYYNVGRGGCVEVTEVRIRPPEAMPRVQEILRELGLEGVLKVATY